LKALYYITRADLEEGKYVPVEDLLEELRAIQLDFSLYFQGILLAIDRRPKEARKISLKLIRETQSAEYLNKALFLYSDCLAQEGHYKTAKSIIEKLSD